LYRFITNMCEIVPSEKELNVLRIPEIPQGFSHTMITRIINKYSSNFVSTALVRKYGELEPGIYIAPIYKDMNKELFKDELQIAFNKYLRSSSQRKVTITSRQQEPNHNVNYINDKLVNKIEERRVTSTTYIVTNLLRNLLEKIIPNGYTCSTKEGGVCINLDIGLLEKILNGKERDQEPLLGFCQKHPNLCGRKDNGCSRFFKVVKQFHIRFQHSVIDGKEKIYLIFYSCYRRLNNLRISNIIRFLLNDGKGLATLEDLKEVFVNVTTEQSTELYKIVDIKMENPGTYVLVLSPSIGINNQIELRVNVQDNNQNNDQDRYNLKINPTYKNSRKFIEKLCKEFDEHKELSRLTPYSYFTILRNDIKVFKKIIFSNINEITLGGVMYTINDDLVRVD